ncbi:MAG TPA: methylated-DNA--[protein]-cysteine S-methyltransferase [candidate division Zixibacteria bacterium]|jgi:methylated-DNA-[protein]-cysteine S-methyltransferase
MAKTSEHVRYGHITTRDVGEVWYAESDRGLWRIEFDSSKTHFLEHLAADGVSAVLDERGTSATRRALREYFDGLRQSFDLKIDWSRLNGFDRKALQICARIPHGQTLSYGEIARRAGSPGAARAVGQAMGKNPFPIVVPCHRVLRSDGTLGGFGGGVNLKRALLELERAAIPGEGIMPKSSRKVPSRL